MNNYYEKPINCNSAICGITSGELHTFIDRNAMRYIEVFSENKNSKRFTTKNWAAFFFPELWLLYRKMFLYALLKAIASILICVTVFSVLVAIMEPKINEIISSSEDVVVTVPDYMQEYDDWVIDSYKEEYLRQNSKYTKLNSIYVGINCATTFSIMLFNFIFSRYADCIYRGYIVRNSHKKGGVSIVAVIIPIALIFSFLVYRILG